MPGPPNTWERRGKWVAQRFGMKPTDLARILDTAMAGQGTGSTPATTTTGRAGTGTARRARTRTTKAKATAGAGN